MTVKEIVQNFYEGISRKNDQWSADLAENVVFSDASNKLHSEGKEAFISAFQTFLRAVEKIQVKRLIIEDDHACAIVSYDYVSPKGEKLHQNDAEVWQVANDKITELTIYFDITEFRTFMGR